MNPRATLRLTQAFLLSYGATVVAVVIAGAVNSSPAGEVTQPGAGPQVAVPLATSIPRPPARPASLTDLSLAVKESYDNNVYLVSGNGSAKQNSWVSTLSPKIGFNFAPLLPNQNMLQVLSLGYAPDFVVYHDTSEENYDAHRLAAILKGKVAKYSFNFDTSFNFIDGNAVAPVYPGLDATRSVFASAAPRERREQIQGRAKVVFQYDWSKCFLRPTAALLYYDLMSELRPTVGYQNYADRYDVNGGADFGYKVSKPLALTVGYRYGHQYQQPFPTAIDKTHSNSSSDYQRALFGLEGKPWKWLTVALQAGPDFRTYPDTTATHTTPLSDRNPVYYYGEAGITAELSPRDTLVFKNKQWQWVASTGKLPYFDSLYDLSYRHKFNTSFSLDLSGRVQSSDYTGGNAVSSLRYDLQYSLSAGLTYNFTSHLVANLSYGADFGRNAQDGVPKAEYRDFNRQLVSMGVQFKL